MIKIPCLFERDFADKRRPVLLRTVTSGCEWALTPAAVPTRKRDGTACMVKEGKLFKRYDVKTGRGVVVPIGAVPCIAEADPITGHWPHWVEIDSDPESKWHVEAWTGLRAKDGSRFRDKANLSDGTYELCGPKINGNAEHLEEHVFFCHGDEVLNDVPLDWDGLRAYLEAASIEGIVFRHREGGVLRMCKIRRDDFGFSWPIREKR